jgi:glycosyltransferase involved in cell wall biosynthesis
MQVSVVVITRDKSKILPQCISSAKQVSDDAVIVANADHQFVGFSSQKNYASSKTKYDWILSLDDDEWLSQELISEIKNLEPTCQAYKIPRLNYIFGKPIYHTNWDPNSDTHIWLYDKRYGEWTGEVHEEIDTRGRVGLLKGYKIHQNYVSVEQFVNKLNNYTSRENKFHNPIYEFLRRYIWHRGFLDGWHGLFLSYLMMYYHTVVWVKLWQKKNIC